MAIKVPRKHMKDTFKEYRKSIAGSHVPMRQIRMGGAAYREGFSKIDWTKKGTKK